MKRFILSDTQTAQSIVMAAAEALRAIGCQFVVMAEDAKEVTRLTSDSVQWLRGALENTLEDLDELRHLVQQSDEGPVGPAEP